MVALELGWVPAICGVAAMLAVMPLQVGVGVWGFGGGEGGWGEICMLCIGGRNECESVHLVCGS